MDGSWLNSLESCLFTEPGIIATCASYRRAETRVRPLLLPGNWASEAGFLTDIRAYVCSPRLCSLPQAKKRAPLPQGGLFFRAESINSGRQSLLLSFVKDCMTYENISRCRTKGRSRGSREGRNFPQMKRKRIQLDSQVACPSFQEHHKQEGRA